MRQHHALGIPRTPRRVLQKGEIMRLHRGSDSGTVCGQLRYRDDTVEPLNLGAEEPRQRFRFGHGQQHHGLSITENAHLTVQVLLKL